MSKESEEAPCYLKRVEKITVGDGLLDIDLLIVLQYRKILYYVTVCEFIMIDITPIIVTHVQVAR